MVPLSTGVVLVGSFLGYCGSSSVSASWTGQASGWISGARDTSLVAQAGLRYLPQFSLRIATSENLSAELEASVNGFVNARVRGLDRPEGAWQVYPYRVWTRVSSKRIETRIGLQRINFGSATLLRPLMWFDRIDPRDPLQMTDGVYALLCRYYFGEQGNVWAWVLLGNSKRKGWEVYPSLRWTPELGGRIQAPVPRGEVALSGHYRRLSFNSAIPEMPEAGKELRCGLDGRWDIGIGLSFEGVASHEWSEPSFSLPFSWWQEAIMLGADYTFALGNGITVLAEHMVVNRTVNALDFHGLHHITGTNLSYPFGLVDALRALVLYDWTGKNWYRFVTWQRTLDNWSFNLAVFWNPDKIQLTLPQSTGILTGQGIQLMVVFNH